MTNNVQEKPNMIIVDGVEYVKKVAATGESAVVVVDRGWMFAGRVEDKVGRVVIHDPIWVFRWESVGFDGVLANPKQDSVKLRVLDKEQVSLPADAEVFRVPVEDSWGR